jgi:hypothetical protein
MSDLSTSTVSRRNFLRGAAVAGTGLGALLLTPAGLALAAPSTVSQDSTLSQDSSLSNGDKAILIAAEIAEALAVTTYTGIIKRAGFFGRLAPDDQRYLTAAREEEMSHYLLERSVSGKPTPFEEFYYPKHMFDNAQVTLNTLVTLEDAFIAAYLVGVRTFNSSELRVVAARIMGIESDHRTLARVVGPGVAMHDGGPIEHITGIQGVAESVDPPNNNGYERTLGWTNISQAVNALLPFVDKAKANAAGFDTSRKFEFEEFKPVLPSPLGAF